MRNAFIIHSFSKNELVQRVMWPLNSVAKVNQLSRNVCVFFGIQCSKFYSAYFIHNATSRLPKLVSLTRFVA